MITDEMIRAAAEAEMAFDGRDFSGLNAADQKRHLARTREGLSAALAEAWRSVETAPKDGTAVLVYNPFVGPYSSAWDAKRQAFPLGYSVSSQGRWISGEWFPVATHWMPFPQPPKHVPADRGSGTSVALGGSFVPTLHDIIDALNDRIGGLRSQLEAASAVVSADEQRLADAAQRVGLHYGCDTPDAMADEIELLRKDLRQLAAATTDLIRAMEAALRRPFRAPALARVKLDSGECKPVSEILSCAKASAIRAHARALETGRRAASEASSHG